MVFLIKSYLGHLCGTSVFVFIFSILPLGTGSLDPVCLYVCHEIAMEIKMLLQFENYEQRCTKYSQGTPKQCVSRLDSNLQHRSDNLNIFFKRH